MEGPGYPRPAVQPHLWLNTHLLAHPCRQHAPIPKPHPDANPGITHHLRGYRGNPPSLRSPEISLQSSRRSEEAYLSDEVLPTTLTLFLALALTLAQALSTQT